jgi:hypothetical protein
MSNGLAIAAVTSTFRYILDRALQAPHPGPVGGASVTTLPVQQLANTDLAGTAGINLFCYQVTPNHAWNLSDLPTRRPDGSLVQRPVAALDLQYLITCHGQDTSLEPQRLVGRVVSALSVNPVFTRDVVDAALSLYAGDTQTSFLAESDLADEIELVKLSPFTLSLEELSKLWGVFGTPYLLSLTYLATVVLIEAEVSPRTSLPVRQRTVTIIAAGAPRLDSVDTDPPGEPVLSGTTLVLRGSGLLGPATQVRIGPATLERAAGPGGAEFRVVLTDAVPAGMLAVQVTQSSPAGPGGIPPARTIATSNTLPLLVRPVVTVAGITSDTVALSVKPPLAAGQRATVLLSRLAGGGPGDPGDLTISLPAVATTAAPQSSVELHREVIPDGRWLVRLRVDGVDSLPELAGETYGAPALTLPPL